MSTERPSVLEPDRDPAARVLVRATIALLLVLTFLGAVAVIGLASVPAR